MINNINKRGETLIEVLTALTALVLASISSVTLIIAVMNSTAISKDYLIAQNLAREAIEGVVNIRDTNWLRYPSDKEASWMKIGCHPDDLVVTSESPYTIGKDPTTKCNELSSSNQGPLDLATKGEATNNAYKLYQNADAFPVYYRSITLKEIPQTPAPSTPQKYAVESKVQWMNKSKVETYILKTIITNYEN